MTGLEVLIPLGFFATIAYIVRSVIRFRERKLELLSGRRDYLPHEIPERLDRMEQAIDAMALEIERIGESQRFTQQLVQGAVPPGGGRSLPESSRQH